MIKYGLSLGCVFIALNTFSTQISLAKGTFKHLSVPRFLQSSICSTEVETVYTEEELNDFPTSWYLEETENHADPKEPPDTLVSLVGVGGDSGEGIIFVFGGKTKFGKSNRGWIYDPNTCACSDDDFESCTCEEPEGCDEECDEDERMQGIWKSDIPSSTELLFKPEEEFQVKHIGENKFLIFGSDEGLGMYDYNTQAYSLLPSMPEEQKFGIRIKVCTVMLNSRMYVLFGTTENEEDEDVYMLDVWSYSLSSNEWRIEYNASSDGCIWDLENADAYPSRCPQPRESPGCVVLKDRNSILVYGGVNELGTLDDMWILDLGTASWKRESNQYPSLQGHVLVNHESIPGVAIAVGGIDENDQSFLGIRVLNLTDFSFLNIPAVEPAPVLIGHAAMVLNGTLYVYGGVGRNEVKHSKLYTYDFNEGQCPSACIGKGKCINRICHCNKGYTGPNCNQKDYTIEYIMLSKNVGSTVKTLCIIGMLACTGFAMLLFILRKRPGVKAFFPNLLVSCLFGCVLSFSLAFVTTESMYPYEYENMASFTIPEHYCYFETIGYPMAFSITFGSILSKVKTTYDVFNIQKIINRFNSGRKIKKSKRFLNRYMPLFLTVLISVTSSIYMLITEPIDPQWIRAKSDDEYNIIFVPSCYGQSASNSHRAVYGIFGAIALLYGIQLAYLTRKLKVFVDAKLVGITVYSLAIILGPTFIFTGILKDDLDALILTLFIGISTSLFTIIATMILPAFMSRNLTRKEVMSLLDENFYASQNSIDSGIESDSADIKQVKPHSSRSAVKVHPSTRGRSSTQETIN